MVSRKTYIMHSQSKTYEEMILLLGAALILRFPLSNL